jgi:hypothetical protein
MLEGCTINVSNPFSASALQQIYEKVGAEGIAIYIRHVRENLFLTDYSPLTVRSLLKSLNEFGWSLSEPWLDINDPKNFEQVKLEVAEHLRSGRELSSDMRELAARLILGELQAAPPRGPKLSKTTPENTFIALNFLKSLSKIGIPPTLSEDWGGNDRDTGASIVAAALGVSEKLVKDWWAKYRNFEKAEGSDDKAETGPRSD